MFLRLVIWSVLLGAILAGRMVALKEGHGATWAALWQRFSERGDAGYSSERLQVELMDQLNHVRLANGQPWLQFDGELSRWLQAKLDDGMTLDNLDRVCSTVIEELPRYGRVSGGSSFGASMTMLKEQFHDYVLAPKDETLTHMAYGMRRSNGGLSLEAILLVVQRPREFAPELLHRTQDSVFFARCPHCDFGHTLKAMRGRNSSTLECPNCSRIYAMIAADSHERFHYVNEFLTGYQPNAVYPRGQTRIEQLFAIWAAVHQHCRYIRDPGEAKQQTDRWQTALETLVLGQGDCEDSAILLADWLIARGFDTRVALGKYGDIGGHAWCVVRVDDREYLLESTSEGNPDFDRPPLVSRVGSRYVPEVLFDRWTLYVRSAPMQPWNGDYWSDRNWLAVTPRVEATADPVANRTQVYSANPGSDIPHIRSHEVAVDPSRTAYLRPLDARSAPFLRLQSLKPGAPQWQVRSAKPNWALMP